MRTRWEGREEGQVLVPRVWSLTQGEGSLQAEPPPGICARIWSCNRKEEIKRQQEKSSTVKNAYHLWLQANHSSFHQDWNAVNKL